jgi:drug/metabolite transporter (DMT)-like permease
MIASFLAAFFFALTGTCGTYNIRANGPVIGNLGRLLTASIVLGLFAHTLGHGFASASMGWFMLSGVIGMGLGDLGVYAALPLLGSRITVLMTQCLAAPLAALGEWLWLGTTLTAAQAWWGLLILAGVAIAITPSKRSPAQKDVKPIGYVFGLVAAAGQGFGALVSRKGVLVAEAAGEAARNPTFGLNAAYHRILAGLAFTSTWFLVLRLINRLPRATVEPTGRHRIRWILAAGFTGPVIAVSCYQWALASTPSGIVLPIAATAPLLAIPITFLLEGDRPTRRAIVGGVLAVAGCAALTLAK